MDMTDTNNNSLHTIEQQQLTNLQLSHEQALQSLHHRIAELESALQLSKDLIDSAPVFWSYLSNDGTLLDTNDLSLAAIGKTRNEVVGQLFWETPWFADLPASADKVRQICELAKKGQSFRLDLQYWSKPQDCVVGEILWTDFQANPEFDQAGNVWRIAVCGVDVTDRVLTQLALQSSQASYRQSQEKWQQALANAKMMRWHLDLKTWQITHDENCHALKDADHGPKDMQTSAKQWVHPDDLPRISKALTEAIQNQQIYFQEYRVLHPDGTIKWMLSQGSPKYDAQGVPLTMSGVRIDITKQKEATMEAELLHRQLHDFFIQAPMPVAIMDGPEHRFKMANALYEKFFNRQVIGKIPREVFAPEEMAQRLLILDEVYKTGMPYSGKQLSLCIRDADGIPQQLWADVSYYPYRDSQNYVQGIFVMLQDVTEQVTSQREIEAREARFRLIADTLPQIVWMKDTSGGVTYASQRWFDLTGLTPKQTLGAGWQCAVHPDDLKQALNKLHAGLVACQPVRASYRLRRGDGQYLHHLGMGVPVRDSTDLVLYWIGTLTDIDHQKRAEARLLNVIESTSDSFYATDSHGCISRVNSHFAHMVKKTREELLGQNFWEIFPDLVGTSYWHASCRVMQERQGIDFEIFDEQLAIWMAVNLFPIQENGIAGFCRDITEQKNAALALQASEQRFRTYAEAMPQMAFICDSQDKLLYCNQQFREYFDLTMNTDNWRWSEQMPLICHPDDLPRAKFAWQEAAQTHTYKIELRLKRHDGAYRWHLAQAVALFDFQGDIVQWLGMKTDIHAQKQDQEKLAVALQARDELLSICSHELITPIANMKLSLQIFERQMTKSKPATISIERVQQMVEQTDNQLDRLTRLIKQMLDFSRMSQGYLEIQQEHFDLVQLVEEMIGQLHLQFAEVDVEIVFQATSPVYGYWDKFRLEQVIVNLLTNALKYGSKNPVHVEITQTPTTAILTVQDFGVGINSIDQERIFQPYERASTVGHISGLGLGLYISAQIAQAHGGSIELQSEPGHGSTFKVVLPKVC